MDTILDLRTLAVVLMLISFALSAVMVYVWRSSRIYDGFGWWTAGTVAASATFIALALIGTASPLASIILSSAAGTGSLITSYLGIRRFFGRPMPYKPALAAWLTSIAAALWFTQINPNPTFRITAISLVIAVVAFCSALEFKAEGDRETRLVYRVAFWSYALFSLWTIVRIGVSLFDASQVPGAIATSTGAAWTLAVYIVYHVFWTCNYLILNNQRLRVDLENAKSELERQATTDYLTGVANSRSFFEMGANELSRSRRFNYPISVVVFDLDGFKAVNDTHGHAAGDETLKAAVAACLAKLRSTDTLARLGGDEFVVLLAYSTTEKARIVADLLRESIEALEIYYSDETLRITASFGIAEIAPTDEDIQSLLARADEHLYNAKRLGRNRVSADSPTNAIESIAT